MAIAKNNSKCGRCGCHISIGDEVSFQDNKVNIAYVTAQTDGYKNTSKTSMVHFDFSACDKLSLESTGRTYTGQKERSDNEIKLLLDAVESNVHALSMDDDYLSRLSIMFDLSIDEYKAELESQIDQAKYKLSIYIKG